MIKIFYSNRIVVMKNLIQNLINNMKTTKLKSQNNYNYLLNAFIKYVNIKYSFGN
jgi:hypothetical protein